MIFASLMVRVASLGVEPARMRDNRRGGHCREDQCDNQRNDARQSHDCFPFVTEREQETLEGLMCQGRGLMSAFDPFLPLETGAKLT